MGWGHLTPSWTCREQVWRGNGTLFALPVECVCGLLEGGTPKSAVVMTGPTKMWALPRASTQDLCTIGEKSKGGLSNRGNGSWDLG